MSLIKIDELIDHLNALLNFAKEDFIFKVYTNRVKATRDFYVALVNDGSEIKSKDLDELAVLLSDILNTMESKKAESKVIEKSDYGRYMDIQTSLMDISDVIIIISGAFKEYCTEALLTRDYSSMLILGVLYEHGFGLEKRKDKAIEFYEASALKQNAAAQYVLASYFYKQKEYDKAQYWASKAHSHGIKQACAMLGKSYYYGKDRNQHYEQIIELLDNEYVDLDDEVTSILVDSYFSGKGVAKDYDKVISLLRNYDDKGKDKWICYRLGYAYFHANTLRDENLGKRWYMLAADLGFMPAILELINITSNSERLKYQYKAASLGDVNSVKAVVAACEEGRMQNTDPEQVMSWYESIAKDGDEEIGLHIANIYAKGKIVPKNQYRAFVWFLKVAEWGNVDAALAVANRMKNGIGTQVNEIEALAWYQKAAVGGSLEAQSIIGKYCFDAGEYENAFSYLSAASEGNEDETLCLLADCYLHGLGTNVDRDKAFYYYQIAASYGNLDALCKIGVFYEEAADYSTAIQWYTKAMNAGSLDARLRIAMLYYQGNGVLQNINVAVKMVSDLAYNNHIVSQLWLGFFYEHGIVVEKDAYIAALWYVKAAQAGSQDAIEYAKRLKDKITKFEINSPTYGISSLNKNSKNGKALSVLAELHI